MTGQPSTRSPDASMSLINELLHRPIDPGYAAVAARRRRAGVVEPQRPGGALLFVTAIVIGLIFGAAAMTLTARQTERSSARTELIGQIEARRERVEVNSARVSELQEEVALAQEQIVRDSSGLAAAGLANTLTISVGALGVHGPGMSVTIDDAPVAPGEEPNSQSKVVSQDLQVVVNALWASGAEAIDVGGQRLTSRSAIRFAGEAILVNYRPLNRPYVVRAIGDPNRLTRDFAGGDGGAYLKMLSDNLGIRVNVSTEGDIVMKSASALRIENAKPADEEATP